MDGNKDEALRALSISQKHRNAGNFPSARKFALKSLSLFETPEAKKLLEIIERESASAADGPSSPEPNGSAYASTSSAETHPSAGGSKHRHTASTPNDKGKGTASGSGGEKREYTAEQHAVVKRVIACKVTEYYEILSVKKDCEEGDIKKAYRKLALALHPDKNGAPGADEAFKMVSKAFQILSDPQKRTVFDQSGGDPEDRFGGMRSPSSGFASSPFGGGGFEGEMSPEDLFNMFFGGGNFGPGFGGGPVFTTTFGPGGFRTVNLGGQRRRPQQQANAEPRSMLIQLLPILILFGFSMLSALPNLFTTPPPPDPKFNWKKEGRYNMELTTDSYGVKYHVNPNEMMLHPIIGAELIKEGHDLRKGQPIRGKGTRKPPGLSKFERTVENTWTNTKYAECQRGIDNIQRQLDRERGIFGIGTDWEKVKTLEETQVESCTELRRLGIIR